MITVLIWKKPCIDLFIERLDIVLSDFCPDICPWADIAVGKIDVITYKYVIIRDYYMAFSISALVSARYSHIKASYGSRADTRDDMENFML